MVLIKNCPCFVCNRVNFLHSSWYSAVFWICDPNRAYEILLQSSACTEPRNFLLLMLPCQ